MNELYHHGIQGQKWGIRRFQNPDGSLTAAGKARLSSNKKPSAKEKRQEYKERTSKINAMSDDELRTRINRLKMEAELKDLEKANIRKGKKTVDDILASSGKQIASRVLTAAAIATIAAGTGVALGKGGFTDTLFNILKGRI